jgi:hypothetical protein
VADVLGRLIWGTDTGAFYREIARLLELPTGTKVLDIPCGSGVALRRPRPAARRCCIVAHCGSDAESAASHHKQKCPHGQPAWLLLMKASAPAVGLIVSWTHGTRASASGR